MLKGNTVHELDALVGLRALPEDSVDLIVTDPPYNIASESRTTMRGGKIISTKEAFGHWDTFEPFDYDLLILQVISECFRVLKPGGALYMFTAREDSGWFIRLARLRGFVYRTQLAIVKKSPLPSFAKSNWRSALELCMYLTKGKPSVFNFDSQKERVNVYHSHNAERKTKQHPTEKPIEFIRRIVQASSNRGDLILDPFMGSGTTAVASAELGRRFLGFDTNPEYVAMANARAKAAREAREDAA